MSIILIGFLASLAAGLATGVGALPAIFLRDVSVKTQDTLLGFAAGVMLSASFFSLILPGLAAAEAIHGSEVTAVVVVIAGLLIGAITLWMLNDYVPHEHFIMGRQGAPSTSLKKIWLFVIAITIHNFPEGLAVGVGFGGNDIENGTVLAIGIGLQNMPEGLAVAVALLGEGYSRRYAFLVALLTGLVEPIGGLIGVAAVAISEPLLPWGLAFAAGAMIYVISHEIIPETHRRGHENHGTGGLLVGLVVMMFLDVVLG
jgi:zinc transporter, ZIP family